MTLMLFLKANYWHVLVNDRVLLLPLGRALQRPLHVMTLLCTMCRTFSKDIFGIVTENPTRVKIMY